MPLISKEIIPKLSSLTIGTAMVAALAGTSWAMIQGQGSRTIVLDEFTGARPAKASASPTLATSRRRTRPAASSNRLTRPPTYRLAGTTAFAKRPASSSTRPARTEELGITVWRLRPSKKTDTGARLLIMESSQASAWTPERIEADTPLSVGERVRISVESPRAGYLYVVDREQYADGSLGEAYLIFPTLRTHYGDNKVQPGKLIDLPAQEDNPNYFTLTPSPNRRDQVAEVLSFIVTPEPLEQLQITEKPLKISKSDIAKWEKTWSSEIDRFEMEGGAGRTWTKEEKEASATASARLLTQEEPAPQTVYRIVSRSREAVLVTIPLRYGK